MKYYLVIIGFLLIGSLAYGQRGRGDQISVTYEELYDDPYDINKLFIHFQPLYGELFATNVTAGFGIEAQYYLKDKFDFKAHGRLAYARPTDSSRDIAFKNSDTQNEPESYNYYEVVATYHIVDREESGESNLTWYSKRYKGTQWSSQVPNQSKIPSKTRRIYGARLGSFYWDSSTDFRRAMEEQGVALTNAMGDSLPSNASLFGNVSSLGLFIGGSLTLIKNIAVKPETTYDISVDDFIFTTFVDLIIAPGVDVQDIVYNNDIYASTPLKTTTIGFRAGIEGKFNRELGWAYGAEVGLRPSLQTRTFYALLKVSFPVFSTKLAGKVEAYAK